MGAFLLFGTQGVLAGCASAGGESAGGESVRVRHVFDGDTLELEDGRRVRLIGVNTPELGREGRPDQPLAEEARRLLAALVDRHSLRMVVGSQSKDRYGRVLAHLFSDAGDSIEERLISAGLGFQISIPPNLAQRDCLRAAERLARSAGRGLWQHRAVVDVASASRLSSGFQSLSGRITRVDQTRHGWFLELEGRVVLQIPRQSLPYFAGEDFRRWRGRAVEVRGWLVPRQLSRRQADKGYRPWIMKVLHPDAFL